jgi:hypothetical protein
MLSKRTTGGGSDVYALGLNPGDFVPYARLVLDGIEHTVSANASLSPGGWSHLAATYDGNNIYLYINGVETVSEVAGGRIGASNVALHLGDRKGEADGRRYAGQMDDVRIYPRALSPQEISAVMNGGSASAQKSLSLTPPPISGEAATEETSSPDEVFVYPNPAVYPDDPAIRITGAGTGPVELAIFDVSGQVVHQQTILPETTSADQSRIDYVWAEPKASGVYYVVVLDRSFGGTTPVKTKFAVVR